MNDISSSNPLDPTAMLNLTVQSVTDQRVLTVIAKLHTDLSRDFTAEELGQKVGLRESQMRAVFKKIMGVSLMRFIKQERLTEAHYLFATEFLTVAKVMARVGFHDRSHFNREFKAAFGMPPGEFRKQCLAGKCPTAV